jgi:hypothetical protein
MSRSSRRSVESRSHDLLSRGEVAMVKETFLVVSQDTEGFTKDFYAKVC